MSQFTYLQVFFFSTMGTQLGILHFRLRTLAMLSLFWNTIEAQTQYRIPEELKVGYVVGNIAKDLDLELSEISTRKMRIASEGGKQYFSVDLKKGELIVNERIDRESLCGQSASCVLPLEAIVENPLQLHRVEIELQDINDNSPVFMNNENILNIAESALPGVKFRIKSAQDPDVGSNSIRVYSLSKNDHFVLNQKTNKDGTKIPELVLNQLLDRETVAKHSLFLTAADGGNPPRTGTTEIIVNVLDQNDNAPAFQKPLYDVKLLENIGIGTTFLTVKAIDIDEGVNSEIVYSFEPNTAESLMQVFFVDSKTGDIAIKNGLDFEMERFYKFDLIATDRGLFAMQGMCTVEVDVTDVNDNIPEVIFKSKPSPVKEDAPKGTVVALLSARDIDSGDNGKVILTLTAGVPFVLNPSGSNNYALLTDHALDRESNPKYAIEITARDFGKPPLSSKHLIDVTVLDVNDNSPLFSQPFYTVYVQENDKPGSILNSVTTSDYDLGDNAKISYSILETKVEDVSVSSYVYINTENGSIYSMHSFDYEKLKVFQIRVQAKDHGSPSLSSNVTVHVFILDQNDNAPTLIYPSAAMSSVTHQTMPRFAKAGHLVTKVTAVDADSGHNAWVSYRLAEETDNTLFSVHRYTGEVRTKRPVSELDDSSQRLLIEIKDNGEPAQSAAVTVNILIEDFFHEPMSNFRQETVETNKRSSKISFYLILSLASVSLLSLLTFLALVVNCIRTRKSSSRCCFRRADSNGYKNPNRNLQIQLNTDGPIKYVEVLGGDMLSQSQSFRSCLSPMSEFSDFTLVKPSSTGDFNDTINVLDASLPDSAWTFESQQQQKPQPNDWRFTMNQRPGPSGAGPRPDEAGVVVAGTGPWPNPPTEAEQLQALIAAANEVSEATATLGPRYNAQFPMQHVPDYRQNVYIPGSTATLTANPQQQQQQQQMQQQQQQQMQQQQALPAAQAMPQVDAPKAAQTPASKKKSTKKDKK